MTLQSSGAISISQMRNEYGLPNPISMSHFYGKNGLPGSGVIRFSDFYGKSNIIDQQLVTVGFFTGAPSYYQTYGYIQGAAEPGAISDGTFLIGNAPITSLAHTNQFTSNAFYMSVSGIIANSGWNGIKIGSTVYNRADAVYSTPASSSRWQWNGVGPNPFPAKGQQITVYFF